MTLASIIIPACNESRVIRRLLSQLVPSAGQDEFEIIVVANGCTDDTAEVARSFEPHVRVLSLAAASKREALAAGNRTATVFPRVYVDADVEIGAKDIHALAKALGHSGVLAVTPRLELAMEGTPWPVRWYWDVWTRLPEVRRGLFGRGVVAVSEAGYRRIAKLPPVFADDLAASLAFSPAERAVVDDACVGVHPPRTFRDLMRIRIRAAIGVAQVEQTEGAPPSTARTRPSDLLAIVANEPLMVSRVSLFALVAGLVRWRATRAYRAGDGVKWLRDESSRRAALQTGTATPAVGQHKPVGPAMRVALAGMEFDRLSEAEVTEHVIKASISGDGGWVATPNIDICRKAERDPDVRALLGTASLTVPDGMPLVWAARLSGDPLPERVSGSSLIFSLTAAAVTSGRSIYLLGGAPGVPESAADELSRLYPGVKVVGTAAPPIGFDKNVEKMAEVRDHLVAKAPDIVYVGLGFPKQEQVIAELASALPSAWFVACGAAIPFAARALPRAPVWMRQTGLEWVFRLISEPRRLSKRYLVDDTPYAARLIASCAAKRIRRPSPGRSSGR
jgi:N-acetylglucosaminyldiphosphoundecaprenol N-acetyl-beta-D-mannosaminyltransferase